MWFHSGSTTPFSNQIDALLDQGFFVLRIFIDSDARLGPTLRRRLERLYPEATMDAAPHVEVFACPDGDYEPLDRSPADEAYRALVRSRMSATTDDELVARLAARAGVAIVNYAVNLAFAVRVCPAARIVLETHDYVTRQTIERSRHSQDAQGFPSCSSIRRHVELEHLLWRAADVCVSLSLSELAKMRRYCAASAYVLPRPYTRRSSDPAANARWDIVIVANPHPLNVQSVEWFLAEVICKSEILTGLRIAIVGRIREDLEDLWRGKLPSVHWLGYVRDIEELRDQARPAFVAPQTKWRQFRP